MTRLVFVPMSTPAAQALRKEGAEAAIGGFADTTGLRTTLGDIDPDSDEVVFAAQTHAGVAALLGDLEVPRLVLATELDDRQVRDHPGDLGEVAVAGLRWPQVLSLFAHDPAGDAMVARARAAVRRLDLAAALARPEVAELLDAYDLLWYDPEELDRLPGAAG